MDWLPGLLKQLAVARSGVAAAFVTSAVLYLGPRLFPNYVDPVPKEWAAAVVGTVVFTDCLLATGIGQGVWRAVSRRWSATTAMVASYDLTQLEVDFLYALGQHPAEPLNLETVDYARLNLSRLEVLEMVEGLKKKGLITVNMYDDRLISLTTRGRTRALEIQRSSNRGAA